MLIKNTIISKKPKKKLLIQLIKKILFNKN